MERSHTTKAALEQELAQWQQRCAALEAELAAKDSAMHEAQATLEHSAAYNKRVYQDSPVPIVIIDPAIGIVDCNMAAVHIYGFQSHAEVLGRMPLDFSAPVQYDGTDTQTAGEEITRSIVEHGIANFLWRARRANGEIFDAEVNLMAFDCGGRILLRFTVDDVSEKRRARLEIERHHYSKKQPLSVGFFFVRIPQCWRDFRAWPRERHPSEPPRFHPHRRLSVLRFLWWSRERARGHFMY